uniref:Tyrosine 3-monooxygenase n=1 Tax=Lygus hesperus TaxID=30085 RepID=A0A0A9VVX0_LYGHE
MKMQYLLNDSPGGRRKTSKTVVGRYRGGSFDTWRASMEEHCSRQKNRSPTPGNHIFYFLRQNNHHGSNKSLLNLLEGVQDEELGKRPNRAPTQPKIPPITVHVCDLENPSICVCHTITATYPTT